MKKYTHAWLAFMAIKRLDEKKNKLSTANQKYADNLITWFHNHRDDVMQGAWYPDAVIHDMTNSHVLKITPSDTEKNRFKNLPGTYLSYQLTKDSPMKRKSFKIADKNDNLPDRCESIAHSVIDHLKMQQKEKKGSPVAPTSNQLALILFMLSHYVADAHMPLHCDNRDFSAGWNFHRKIEEEWDKEIKQFYPIDEQNERFYYTQDGYPKNESENNPAYLSSFLKKVGDTLADREFQITWGAKNKNVWDFMDAICQHSYLLSYLFIPETHKESSDTDVTLQNWQTLGDISFEEFSVAVFTDTIDSITRIWFRLWRKYMKWKKKH